jgi:hypothetical protein
MVTVVRGDVILCDLNPGAAPGRVRTSEQKSRVVKTNDSKLSGCHQTVTRRPDTGALPLHTERKP